MNTATALIKKVFDYFVWVAFFGFLLLGVVIYATNNTYPGDKMYPFKLKFEEFVLLTSKVLNKQVDFSIDLVSKRSHEVAKILSSKNSAETLNRLDTQVELTAASIAQISDPVERKKAAEEYIVKLNEASIILSEKEKELLGSSTTYSQATNTEIQPTVVQNSQVTPQPTVQLSASELTISPTVIPTAVTTQTTEQQPTVIPPTPTEIPPTPTTAPVIAPTNISQQINNSQTTIQQTIIEMQNLAAKGDSESKKELKEEILNKLEEKGIDKEDIKNIKNKKEDD